MNSSKAVSLESVIGKFFSKTAWMPVFFLSVEGVSSCKNSLYDSICTLRRSGESTCFVDLDKYILLPFILFLFKPFDIIFLHWGVKKLLTSRRTTACLVNK